MHQFCSNDRKRTIARPSKMKESNSIIERDIQTILAAPLPWQDFDGKTVLVSGANGFLANYVVKTLLNVNHVVPGIRVRVHALVRSRVRAAARLGDWIDHPHLRLQEVDLSSANFDVEPNVDYVVHSASLASPRNYRANPVGMAMPNIAGTARLLELAAQRGVSRFLYFSSAEIYGSLRSRRWIQESDAGYLNPTDPRACYAESKRMGETLCVAYASQYDVPTTIVRPFHTYGPGLAEDDGRLVADFVADTIRGNDIRIKSDGRAVRSFCYVGDATIGFFTALLKGGTGEAYNVGNPYATVSIRELAEMLLTLNTRRDARLEFVNPDDDLVPRSRQDVVVPSIEKLERLGWRPTTPIMSGFRRTIASYH